MGPFAAALTELVLGCVLLMSSGPSLASAPAREKKAEFLRVRAPALPGWLALEPAPDPVRFRILIEPGLEEDTVAFTRAVLHVLGDARGWSAAGRPFLMVDEDEDFSVVLARPKMVDHLCAPLTTGGIYSCGRGGRAVMNYRRWRLGVPATWGDDLDGYREYMINHEVGHLLYRPHKGCPEPGAPAFVMAQQSIRLDGCEPRGWPRREEVDALRRRWERRASRR